VPAATTVAELNAQAAPQAALWPLWLEPRQSLGDLFLSARFSSRSFRFGSLADNVLGLRWILPNGQRVDLGGRVVKNVTGFDLVRFLNASGGRFGRPENLVLRLRPLAPRQRVATLAGPWASLDRFVSRLLADSWAHALDAVDLQGGEVHVSFANEASLLPLFEKAMLARAAAASLELSFSDDLPAHSAKPWARAQLPLSQMLKAAEAWAGPASGFLGQGLLHLEPGTPEALRSLHQRLAPEGGQVEHPSIPVDTRAAQARWEEALLTRMAVL
jgi:FAD/FMN-containing dehydrogenase